MLSVLRFAWARRGLVCIGKLFAVIPGPFLSGLHCFQTALIFTLSDSLRSGEISLDKLHLHAFIQIVKGRIAAAYRNFEGCRTQTGVQ